MRALILFFFFISATLYAGDTLYSVVSVDGKKGMQDEHGNFVISPKYDEIGWTDGTSIPVNGVIGYKKTGKWGLINIKDELLTHSKYENLLPYVGDKFIASIKGKFSHTVFYGVISEKGKSLIDFQYHSLKPIDKYLIALLKVDRQYTYGMLDEEGSQVLDFTYKSIQSISANLIQLELNDNSVKIYHISNQKLIDGNFTSVKVFEKQYLKVRQAQHVGIIDLNGRIIVKPQYEQISYDLETGWRGKSATSWSVLDEEYRHVKSIECQDLTFIGDKVKTINNAGEQLLDLDLEQLSTERFDKIISITGNKILYRNHDEYGLYDFTNQPFVRASKFDTAYVKGEFIYGAKRVKNQLRWALYDTFGIKRTHFNYDQIRRSNNGLFAVKRRGHWGFMDRKGKEVIHCVYSDVGEFKEGLLVVEYHKQYGVINSKNDWIVMPQDDEIEIVNNELYLTRGNLSTKLMSVNDEMIYFTNNDIVLEGDVLIETTKAGEKKLISLKGTFVNKNASSSYDEMKYLNDEYIAVKRNGSFGFVDKRNVLRITNRYEDVGRYNVLGIPVMLLGKWGMINVDEKIIVQPTYDSIFESVDGAGIVRMNNKYGLLSQSGNELIAPQFDKITRQENGEYIVIKNDKCGLVTAKGKYLIDTKYDELERLENDKVIVKKRDRYGTLTLQGVEVIPSIYDQIYYQSSSQRYFAKKEGEWKSLVINNND